MDERINYKSENEKYIIEGDIKKMTNMGSLYGTSSNSKMAAFMRHPNPGQQLKEFFK